MLHMTTDNFVSKVLHSMCLEWRINIRLFIELFQCVGLLFIQEALQIYWQQYVHNKSSTYSEWRYFFFINLQYEIKKNKPLLTFFSDAVMVIILLLTGLNSCVNPWIFLAFSGRMCSKTKLTSRQSGYTCTTGTESDGRYRSSSLYDGNPAIVKFGHMRNGNHMIFRNSRFWICQELLIFYLSVYK